MTEQQTDIKWNPIEKPWRVLPVFQSNASYHHGWRYGATKVFATYEEAYEAFVAKQPAGLISICIDYAMNGATWTRNGHWKQIQKRKRGERPDRVTEAFINRRIEL